MRFDDEFDDRPIPLKCSLGFHAWNGCTCPRCGEWRNEQHDWDGCVCTICGKKKGVFHEGHDWDGCVCRKCKQEKAITDNGHDWDGCVCRKCGQLKPESDPAHDWNGCTCRKCGMNRKEGHILDEKCKCEVCGHFFHDLEERTEEWADTEQFEALGGGLENMWMMHQYRSVYVCRRCGADDSPIA